MVIRMIFLVENKEGRAKGFLICSSYAVAVIKLKFLKEDDPTDYLKGAKVYKSGK